MTLINQNSSVTHNGNGVTTQWPYTFIIPDAASARVGLFDIATNVLTELLDTAYSITGINDPNGGEVTYPLVGAPISSAKRLVIWREVSYTQDTEITNQTPFYPTVLEDQLDRIVMQVQQILAETGRSLKVTQGSAVDPDQLVTDLFAAAATASAAAIAASTSAAAAAAAASVAPVEFRDKIINGRFNIAQRPLPVAVGPSSSAFGPDRFAVVTVAGISCNISRTALSAGHAAGRYFMSCGFTGVGASGSFVRHRIEGVDTLADKQVTLGFHIADSAATEGVLQMRQFFGTGGAPSAAVQVNTPITMNNFLTQKKVLMTLPSIVGKTLGTNGDDYLEFLWIPTQANAHNLSLGNVFLVEGDATAQADPVPRNLQQELDLCRRFCQVYGASNAAGNDHLGNGQAHSTTVGVFGIPLNPPMRAEPTLTASGNFNVTQATGAVSGTSTIGSVSMCKDYGRVSATVAASLVAGNATSLISNATGRLIFSAEY